MYIIEIKYDGRETAYVSEDRFTLEHDNYLILKNEDTLFDTIDHAMSDDFYNIYKIPFCGIYYEKTKRPDIYENWFKNMDTSKISVKVIEYKLLQRKIKIKMMKNEI
jgi:hypothetical protein